MGGRRTAGADRPGDVRLTRGALLGWARVYDRAYRRTVWARRESEIKRAIHRRRLGGRPGLSPRLLAILAEWKTPRIRGRIARNPAPAVRRATGSALAARDDASRLRALLALDGVGLPVASVILHFAFPRRYPILDTYVTTALGALGRLPGVPATSPAGWPAYCEALRALSREHRVSLRTLDKALWTLGRALAAKGRGARRDRPSRRAAADEE